MTRLITLFITLVIGAMIGWFTLTPPAPSGAPLPLTDKQLHALAFGLLILPVALTHPRALWWLAPLALVYGAVIEVIQPSAGRNAEWADFLADGVGVAFACGLGYLRVRVAERARA
jgi:hypothetical protein